MSGRGSKPTQRGVTGSRPSVPGDISDDAKTNIYDPGESIDRQNKRTPMPPKVAEPAAAKPVIQAISMKTPADPNLKPVAIPEREMPHVKLRAMSEVARQQLPQNLGNLAPPYDPAEARKRTLRDYLIWGSLAVMIASVVALVVWFVAT